MKTLIRNILIEEKKKLKEHYWQDPQTDKWDLLADDLKECIEKLIVKHKSEWNEDQYEVINAIESIMETMFARVGR